ncbi:hypothetical protein ACOME3_002072 [Neoechinorhynchus agilis]
MSVVQNLKEKCVLLRPAIKATACFFCTKSFKNLYTCPRCRLAYCSVKCYQSQEHVSCSEAFFEDQCKETLSGLKSSDEDRKKMSEILVKHYKTQVESEDLSCNNTDRFNDLVSSGAIGQCIEPVEPWWIDSKIPFNSKAPFKMNKLEELTKQPVRHECLINNIVSSVVGYVSVYRRYDGELENNSDAFSDWLTFHSVDQSISINDLFCNMRVRCQNLLGIDKHGFWNGLVSTDVVDGILIDKSNLLNCLFECYRMMRVVGNNAQTRESAYNPFYRNNVQYASLLTKDLKIEMKKWKMKLKFLASYVNELDSLVPLVQKVSHVCSIYNF